MKLSRINDWIKVLGVHLAGGILAIIFKHGYINARYPADIYVLLGFTAAVVVYYAFAGIFLRNVKTYKVAVILIGMSVIACVTPKAIGVFLASGSNVILQIFYYFIEETQRHVMYSGYISILAPFVITYISMKISRFCEKKE